jgi:hypothetical protein
LIAAPKIPYPSKLYAPLNRCAYCSSTQDLSKEHIIPLGLGSDLILPKASCEAHRKATSKVEDFVLRKYLCPLRSHLSLPSRKPSQRPDGYPLTLRRGARSWRQKVKLSQHPGLVRFMILDPPGRVAGRPEVQETYSFRFEDTKIFADIDQRVARLGADSFEDRVAVNPMALARMMAKIGHAFAVAELGIDAFEQTYVSHLITDAAPDWNYWVGSYNRGRDIVAKDLHELKFLRRGPDLSVIVHLFVPYCPRYAYEVIVGRMREGVYVPVDLTEAVYG